VTGLAMLITVAAFTFGGQALTSIVLG